MKGMEEDIFRPLHPFLIMLTYTLFDTNLADVQIYNQYLHY